MLFNSSQFIAFFAVVYALYLAVKPLRQRNILLLVSGYVFYASWDWRYLFLLLGTTLVDYYCGLGIGRTREDDNKGRSRRKKYLLLSIIVNLTVLGTFKYFDFFIASFQELLGILGFQAHLSTLNLILPAGISFYTFQEMSYVIDVYRKKVDHCDNFIDFALFVSYFPHLVAGPIQQARHLLPQLRRQRAITWENIRRGTMLIIVGYFKKVAIADTLAPFVDQCFNDPTSVSGVTSLLGVLAFALQIYGDFAGYTHIARGISLWLGISLTENFHMPYLAVDPRDFWRRWHITLSVWLRDYLYIPLGGNRHGSLHTYRNIMITMLLGGLWHGASWTFVLWGGFHGLLLVAYRFFEPGGAPKTMRLPVRVTRTATTFVLVLFGWLLFRAQSLETLKSVVLNICLNFTWGLETPYYLKPILTFSALLLAYHIWLEYRNNVWALLEINPFVRNVVYAVLLVSVAAFGFKDQQFIYFQF